MNSKYPVFPYYASGAEGPQGTTFKIYNTSNTGSYLVTRDQDPSYNTTYSDGCHYNGIFPKNNTCTITNTWLHPFNMLAFGDSIMWGQGLLPEQKMHEIVKNNLQATLKDKYEEVNKYLFAHSGAIIGYKTRDPLCLANTQPLCIRPDLKPIQGQFGGEVNVGFPTIIEQVRNYLKSYVHANLPDPKNVNLILVDGCANDIDGMNTVTIGWIHKMFYDFPDLEKWAKTRSTAVESSLNDIREKSNMFCYEGMKYLLSKEIGPNFPNAKIIVTGYHLAESDKSDFYKIAKDPKTKLLLGSSPSALNGLVKPPVAKGWNTFYEVSSKDLQKAVDESNNVIPLLSNPITSILIIDNV
jgi:hypothetical protein